MSLQNFSLGPINPIDSPECKANISEQANMSINEAVIVLLQLVNEPLLYLLLKFCFKLIFDGNVVL